MYSENGETFYVSDISEKLMTKMSMTPHPLPLHRHPVWMSTEVESCDVLIDNNEIRLTSNL